MGPIAIIEELILGKPPLVHRIACRSWYSRIVCDEVEPALLIVSMFLQNLAAAFITRFGIVVVHSNIVGAHRAMIVGIGLAIGCVVKFSKRLVPSRLVDSHQQLVLRGIVCIGLWERYAIVRMIGRTETIAVRLYSFVTGTIFAGWVRADLGQQTAFRITWDSIWTHFLVESSKVMLVMENAYLNTIPLFSI